MSIKKSSVYLQNADLLVCSDCKPLLKIFKGHTDTDKCNTWGLEAAANPRYIIVQHIKGIANVLTDSLSRLRAVGLYHDFNFKTTHRNSVDHFVAMLTQLIVQLPKKELWCTQIQCEHGPLHNLFMRKSVTG